MKLKHILLGLWRVTLFPLFMICLIFAVLATAYAWIALMDYFQVETRFGCWGGVMYVAPALVPILLVGCYALKDGLEKLDEIGRRGGE